jgi:hypothetical protein
MFFKKVTKTPSKICHKTDVQNIKCKCKLLRQCTTMLGAVHNILLRILFVNFYYFGSTKKHARTFVTNHEGPRKRHKRVLTDSKGIG